VLTLTRDTSTVTADENSGDTAALQRDGTTLRNDSIAAIAHPMSIGEFSIQVLKKLPG